MVRWLLALALVGCDGGSGDGGCPEGDAACGVRTLLSVDRVELVAACPTTGGATLDVVIGEDARGVTPADLEAAGRAPLSLADFEWGWSALAPVFGDMPQPVTLESRAVDFVGPTGPRRVVFVLDQSASLVGLDPAEGTIEVAKASDPQGARLAFFADLLDRLPAEDEAALIWFRGLFGVVEADYATPTLDRARIRAGIEALAGEELGLTPLARGLIDATTATAGAAAPLIVLFTDGVEGGDSSDLPDRPDPSDLDAAASTLVEAGVPVLVLHLAPPEAAQTPRDRDPALADLACRTGGAYWYLADPSGFDAALLDAVQRRLAGAWRLTVDAGLTGAPEGGWLLDARLSVAEVSGGGRPWIWW